MSLLKIFFSRVCNKSVSYLNIMFLEYVLILDTKVHFPPNKKL